MIKRIMTLIATVALLMTYVACEKDDDQAPAVVNITTEVSMEGKIVSLQMKEVDSNKPIEKYRLQLSENYNFSPMQVYDCEAKEKKFTLPNLQNGKTYYYRYVVSNGSDYMVLQDVNYFRTDLHCKLTLKTNQKGERFANCLSGAGNYSLGYSVHIQAYNVEDYTFVGWSDSVKSRDRMVTLDDDMELTALYEPSQCKLELSAEPEEGGKVYGAGNYLSGDTVTVVAKPAEGYRFVGWSDETLTDSFLLVIKENRSLTAKFERLLYQLALKATEGGIVSGDSLYYHGESATIKATTQPGYSFVGWSDGETNAERTITMVADVSLTAQFAKNTYSVKLSSSPSDGGTTEGAGIYEYGDKATIKAVAATGYSFVGWSDGNTQASRSEVIEESLTLVAEFEANRYRLTLVASPTNGGMVAGGDSYVYGTKVTVEATPAKGYEFVKWSDGETSAKRTVKVEESTTLIAYFAVKKFTVSVAATPSAGGTVAGGGVYEYMTKAKLEATPSLGYTFVKWSDGETSRSRSLDVDSDLELKAVFAPIMYNVTAAVSPLEGGRVSGTGEYTYGQSALLTAIPAKGYKFVGWSDGSKQVTRTEIVTSDLSFLATFIENVYTLSLSATKGGEVAGSGNYKQGTEVEIVATPDAHYHFKSWSDGVEDSLRTIVIEEDLELEAEFEADKYKVTLSVNDSTYGTVEGSGIYEYGDTTVIKAIPNEDCRFVSWSDGSTLSSRTIKVEENLSLVAEFEEINRTITYTVNEVTFKMVYVKGGTFTMGATSEQGSEANSRALPTHRVTLSNYYMGETEVTQALWEAVMGTNPSRFSGSTLPVEYVSWGNCQTFVRKLNALTGADFRLPTEAEWEYAARGGSKSRGYKYSGSNTIGDVAWYSGNSSSRTHPVGTKLPNELGLYDMSGNVLEWCSDWYGDYSSTSSTNPTGPSSGSIRVLRGGCWDDDAGNCRVSLRRSSLPDYWNYIIGLRLSLSSLLEQEADKYKVTLSVNDSTYGTVEGSGIYEYGDSVEIEAIPNEGYCFVSWGDGSTLSSRTIKVEGNLSLVAEFKKIDRTYTVNGVNFKMVYVAGGTFTMGATSEQGSDAETDESPTHRVTLSDYYMGKTEVTQALWQAVMGTNPSYSKGQNLPVERVSWDDCQNFVRKLNALTGADFRLPTEAEWEYAARGGSKSRGYKYSGGNTIDDVAWYSENSSNMTHPVGEKRPNELYLYDMSGNVYEWCSDRYGGYSSYSSTNPTGPSSGSLRVERGGSWSSSARHCRVSGRNYNTPDNWNNSQGLRLCLSSHPEQEADKYKVTLSVNDSTYGTVEGSGIYEYGETVEIEAIPNEGCRFVSWRDGSTSMSRTIKVEENLSLEAVFEKIGSSTDGTTFTVNGVTFKMVYVAGGTFMMGATSEQGSDADLVEKPTHRVKLSDYYMGETEVTQALWEAVMGTNPSYFSGPNLPVEQVSWNDCQTFVRKLNVLTGADFRLPTEAEWEYAARGGGKSRGYKYSGGDTIDDVAWYYDNSSSKTHPVGTKLPNELGLYDMSGNVSEWCSDWYGSYSSTSSTNPTGPSSGSYRVDRGGSKGHTARGCRVSYRSSSNLGRRYDYIGLRLALSSHP